MLTLNQNLESFIRKYFYTYLTFQKLVEKLKVEKNLILTFLNFKIDHFGMKKKHSC